MEEYKEEDSRLMNLLKDKYSRAWYERYGRIEPFHPYPRYARRFPDNYNHICTDVVKNEWVLRTRDDFQSYLQWLPAEMLQPILNQCENGMWYCFGFVSSRLTGKTYKTLAEIAEAERHFLTSAVE